MSKVKDLLYAKIAQDFSGEPKSIGMHTTPERSTAYQTALQASVDFNALVNDPSSNPDDVISALKRRSTAANDFWDNFGIKWPL
jgi:hypothetical protein